VSNQQERIALNTYKPKDADRTFFGVASLAALFSLLLVFLMLIFLLSGSWTTFQQQGLAFVTGSTWEASAEVPSFQIFPMLYGSFLISLLGLVIAVPISISTAYFIEFMANGKVSKFFTSVIDLLAALPSIVIGIWGLLVLTPVATGWSELLTKHLGFIPIFANDEPNAFRSPFIAGIVVAIMIIPIITVVSREVLAQTPQELLDAARGLGGSLWGTVRMVALPHARGGIVGGVMLGLGRALGETVAIYFVLNLIFERVNYYRILDPEGGSVASMIVAKFGEATPEEIQALLGAGLVLFVLTLIVNLIANWIVARSARERLV
jgi:phosphate transport system permease protein